MFNKAILIGRLTADPELKQTTSGIYLVHFQIAVDRRSLPQNRWRLRWSKPQGRREQGSPERPA